MATPASIERIKSRAAEIAGRLPPLLLAAQRIAATIEQGVHGRRRVGRGESFWQYRLYYPGDELRRLDWRQSAKSDRLYLRQMEWSAAQTAYLWCDVSASMHYSSSRDLPTKVEAAEILTMAMAGVLSQAGERVSLLGDTDRPVAGKAVMETIGHRLMHLAASREGEHNRQFSIPPAPALPAHAHVILISDFLAPIQELRSAIERFAHVGCRGHLIQVLDPSEVDLPFSGRIRFEGTEGEGELLMSRTENVREEYHQEFTRHWAELQALARLAGWSVTRHVTDQSAARSLLATYQWLALDHPRHA